MGKKTVSKSKAKGKKDLPEEKTIEEVVSRSLFVDFHTEQSEFCHRINFLLDFLFWDDYVDLKGDAFGAVDCARYIMRANEQKMDEYWKRSIQEKAKLTNQKGNPGHE